MSCFWDTCGLGANWKGWELRNGRSKGRVEGNFAMVALITPRVRLKSFICKIRLETKFIEEQLT